MKQLSICKAWKALALFALIALLAFGGAAGTLAQPFAPDAKTATHNTKIDSALEQLMQMVSAARSGAASEQFAAQHGIPVRNGQVQVVIRLSIPGLAAIVAQAIRQLGLGLVRAQSDHFVALQIPLSYAGLLRLAALSGVGFIRPPVSPQALTVSQGVALTGAAALQANGVRGQGVKIAVIDLGFAGLSNAQAAGELPGSVVTQDFSGSGLQSGSSHGTAVAEIVHDMAPDAQLFLMKISDEVDLENAVNQAIAQGVRIINHSVGWLNTNFYDGTGIIADIANRARAQGVLWVNSAGNYAQRHWQGPGIDSNGDGWVDFSPGNSSLSLNANSGELIQLFLTWNDWPASAQDYDLFLFDDRGTQVASSERLQTGTEQPTESLFFPVSRSGRYSVRVKLAGVSVPKQLSLFALHHDLSPFVSRGSVVAPADAQSVLAVGAIDQLRWSSGPQESFSSQGPTSDGRSKPDLMAPDNVSTYTLGSFRGTSAAAPHVAGAAALLLSENPGESASQLASQLRSQAINMGSPFLFGAGRLNLVSSAPPTGRPDLVLRDLAFSPPRPSLGAPVTISAQVVNQGSAAAGAFAVQINDGFGTASRNFAGLAAGGSLSVSFTRQLQASQETITLIVDPFNQVSESNENNNTAQLNISAGAPPPTALGVQIQTDRSSYRIGDPIRVQFELTGQAFVYIYDVDPQGAVSLLFPGSEASGRQLPGGSYDLGNLLGGMTLRVTGPAGLESVHALATASPINLQLSGLRSSSFSNINVFKSEISRRIQLRSPGLSWGWDAASFQVEGAPPPSNRPPVARFSFSPTAPQVNQVVTFDGSGSFDPDGFITRWHWVFQGNSRIELDSVRPRVRFSTARTYQVTLTVTDNQGVTGSLTQLLQVTNPVPTNRPPVARFTFSPANPQVNQIVSFDGSSSFDPDGSIFQYRWDFNSDGRVDASGVRAQARFTRAADFRVTLTVIDNSGRSNSTTQTLRVRSAGTSPPTPSPTPSSGQAGFFLFSQDLNKFHLIVRGDPSWTSPHAFKALITLTGDLSGNITVKTTGNATPQTTHYAVPTTLTGKVGNGSIEYIIPIRNPGLRFNFDLQMDMNGNGKLQTGTEVPIFFVIGGRNHQVAKNPFFITRTNQSLLPFGSFMLCTSISPTRVRCNPFPG